MIPRNCVQLHVIQLLELQGFVSYPEFRATHYSRFSDRPCSFSPQIVPSYVFAPWGFAPRFLSSPAPFGFPACSFPLVSRDSFHLLFSGAVHNNESARSQPRFITMRVLASFLTGSSGCFLPFPFGLTVVGHRDHCPGVHLVQIRIPL